MGKANGTMLLATLLLSACGADEAILEQRARLDAEQAERMQALADVEARLEVLRTREQLWQELEARHQRVSAIACENVAGHVEEMERHEERQRARENARRHRRLARLDAGSHITPVSTSVPD